MSNPQTNSSSAAGAFDFNALSLANIEQAPGFDIPATGEYTLQVSFKQKAINGQPKLAICYEVLENLSPSPECQATILGTKFEENISLPEGLQYTKAKLMKYCDKAGCDLPQLLDNQFTIKALVKQKQVASKKNEGEMITIANVDKFEIL